MTAIEILAGIMAVLVLVPAAIVFVQVALAFLPVVAHQSPGQRRPSVAVLVPAHDEAEGIAAPLRSILPQLAERDQLWVVADNCSDATAEVAAGAGARVIERTDPDRRGKGYALDFGIRRLTAAPPEVLIVVDADCLVEPGAIDRLACRCQESGRPVQSLYLMHAPLGASLKMRLAEFAWAVKNRVRPLGSRRLGLPCHLMGTGMAFPWDLIRDAQLAHAELVEDMKLGIDLAIAGHPPVFCPEARVTSRFPESGHAVSTQRKRWEHGHIGMILREFPRLLLRSFSRRNIGLLGMALDLAVPPLSLLAMMMAAALVLAFALFSIGASIWMLALVSIAPGLLVLAVLMAWLGWGRSKLSLGDLFLIPFYALAKLPIYLKFWTRRQKEWVRTERN